MQVGVPCAAASGSLVVYGPCVEFLAAVVGGCKVLSRTALVSEAPEDDGGMVAVCEDHALCAVDVLRLPRNVVRDALAVLPCLVAFHIGLVHDVESVVVEHGIHLGLSGIVRGAYCVDVGLFHHGDVAEHGLDVDAASE